MTKRNLHIYTSADADRLLASDQHRYHDDCACDSSNVVIPPIPAALPLDAPLSVCPDLYRDDYSVAGSSIVFNPIVGAGVSLLGDGAAALFDLVDGQRGSADLARLVAAQGFTDYDSALAAVEQLYRSQLVYDGDTPPHPMPQPSRHLGVWLHVTNQCNLRCSYCYVSKTNEHLPLALGKRALRAVFSAAHGQRMSEVTLKYAGGEALLEADTIWALDDYAHELAGDIALDSALLSNGTPLTAPITAQIKARGIKLAVSLDGIGEAHDAQRPLLGGQPSFARVQCGLELAAAAGIAVNVSVVVGPGNMANLPQLIDYLLDRDLHFSLSFLRDSEVASFNLDQQGEALIVAMQAAYRQVAARPPRFSLMNSALDRVQLEQPHFAACGVGDSYVVIKHTGEVSSCQMLLDRPLGHLREGNVIKLVQARTKERPHGFTVDQREGCSDCQWRYRCAGGCPLVSYSTYGRFDQRSPFCAVYKALIPSLIALEGRRIARYCLAA